MPISSGTGILPVQMSRHDKSHGQVSIGDSPRRDARATGVAPIDPSGPANVSWRQTTRAWSRYVFIETALSNSQALAGRHASFPTRRDEASFALKGSKHGARLRINGDAYYAEAPKHARLKDSLCVARAVCVAWGATDSRAKRSRRCSYTNPK